MRLPGAACLVRVETRGAIRTETRFFASSRALTPAEAAQAIRGHWAIENRLRLRSSTSPSPTTSPASARNTAPGPWPPSDTSPSISSEPPRTNGPASPAGRSQDGTPTTSTPSSPHAPPNLDSESRQIVPVRSGDRDRVPARATPTAAARDRRKRMWPCGTGSAVPRVFSGPAGPGSREGPARPSTGRCQEKNWPPFALIVEPVTKPASSEARKTTARAISEASPSRPTGIWAMMASRTFSGTAMTMSVAI